MYFSYETFLFQERFTLKPPIIIWEHFREPIINCDLIKSDLCVSHQNVIFKELSMLCFII